MSSLQASPLLRTLTYYRYQVPLICLVVLLVACSSLTMTVQHHILGESIDALKNGEAVLVSTDAQGNNSYDTSPAWGWAWVLITVAVVRLLFAYASAYAGFILGQRLLHQLRSKILAKVLALDGSYHQEHERGELTSRAIRDCDKVRDAVNIGLRSLLDIALTVVGILIVYAYYSVYLIIAPIVLLIGTAVALQWQSHRLVVRNRAADDAYDIITQKIEETVVGARVVRSFNLQEQQVSSFKTALDGFIAAVRKALTFANVFVPMPVMGFACTHGINLAVGAWLVSQGSISIGNLFAAMLLGTALIFRLNAVNRIVVVMADARSSATRLWELFDAEEKLQDHPHAKDLPQGALGIELEHVCVQFDKRPVLEGASLAVAAGETLAIIGPTGCGKSTLLSLCSRIRDPNSGSISLYNDHWRTAMHDIKLGAIRQNIQLVFQESFLFSRSIRDNLRMFAPDADDEALWHALQIAAAEEFVRDMPEQLDTLIGERGVTVSGGQKQRLCLARAVLAKPRVLLLDDATSALDAATERQVIDRLREHFENLTVVVVASRRSTLAIADRIAVMDKGSIIAEGSFSQLKEHNQRFRHILGISEDAA